MKYSEILKSEKNWINALCKHFYIMHYSATYQITVKQLLLFNVLSYSYASWLQLQAGTPHGHTLYPANHSTIHQLLHTKALNTTPGTPVCMYTYILWQYIPKITHHSAAPIRTHHILYIPTLQHHSTSHYMHSVIAWHQVTWQHSQKLQLGLFIFTNIIAFKKSLN